MIAVIFEVHPREGHAERYFELAAQLRAELEQIEGFISVERFESLTRPGHYLSLSFWRDEEAVRRWRCQGRHRSARGRPSSFHLHSCLVSDAVYLDHAATTPMRREAYAAMTAALLDLPQDPVALRELNADLHCHSTVSDGTLPPAEVAARAACSGAPAPSSAQQCCSCWV